jgi:putative ABC transport system substrate-binding protein
MRRRDFIKAIAGSAAAWPLAANAQQPKVPTIGFLMMYAESDTRGQSFAAAFRGRLNELGWTEGRNIQLEYRWATSDPERIEGSAKELVVSQPALILSSSTTTTAALLKQTRTIPIIFGNLADPVGSGFVESLPKPGGNVTGFINVEPAMTGKWLELLKAVAPRVSRTPSPDQDRMTAVEDRRGTVGMDIHFMRGCGQSVAPPREEAPKQRVSRGSSSLPPGPWPLLTL